MCNSVNIDQAANKPAIREKKKRIDNRTKSCSISSRSVRGVRLNAMNTITSCLYEAGSLKITSKKFFFIYIY